MPERNMPYTVKITETTWDMLVVHAHFLADIGVPTANRLIDLKSIIWCFMKFKIRLFK